MIRNPVYVREVMRSMRAPRMILSIFIFNLLLAVVGIFGIGQAMAETARGSSMDYSVVLEIYQMIASVEWFLMLVMMPSLTAGAISGERERNTLEVLLSTGMGEASIIAGKLLAALSIIMTLLISTLPVLSLVFIYGGIRFLGLILLLLVLCIIAAYMGSICIVFSAFSKTTTFSLICSYAAMLSLTVGTFFLVYMLHSALGNAWKSVSYLLLLNPLVTFLDFIYEQVGEFGRVAGVMDQLGIADQGLIGGNWLWCSLFLQSLAAVFCLFLAARALRPDRRKIK